MSLNADDLKYLNEKFQDVHQSIEDTMAEHINAEGKQLPCPNVQRHLNQRHSIKKTILSVSAVATGLVALWHIGDMLIQTLLKGAGS